MSRAAAERRTQHAVTRQQNEEIAEYLQLKEVAAAHIHAGLPPETKKDVQRRFTDDTRVRTAVAWLEDTELLSREENFVQVFPSSLRVSSAEEAARRLARAAITGTYRGQLLRIVDTLIEAPSDEGVSTDELMGVSRLGLEGVRAALYDLERLGIASNDTALQSTSEPSWTEVP